MSANIQQALRPLLVTCFFMGFGVYPQTQSRSYLSVLYSMTIWLVYGCILYYVATNYRIGLFFADVVTISVGVINILTAATSVITSLYYDKELRACMKELDIVDDTLEELGTPRIYQKINTWSKVLIILWIIYTLFLNFCDGLWWLYVGISQSYWTVFLIPYVINHCFHANLLVDILFIVLLWYIGNRFDKVNQQVQCLLVKEEHELRCTWRKSEVAVHRYTFCVGSYRRVLWTSMQLHLKLRRIASELNYLFGRQMTLEMVAYLIFLTSLLYLIFEIMTLDRYSLPVYSLLNFAIWFLIYLARLYSINCICENVHSKSYEINRIIHELSNILRYADMRPEIHQFTLQTIHHPLKLTGMRFFSFGNEFFRKFCTKVITVVIIIVQLKTPTST